MEETFLLIIEIVGTLAFAISGIRMAAGKKFDWFGAYIVGLATAIGGGTLRDLLLDTTPFWMVNGWYLSVTALALVSVVILKKYLVKLEHTFFIFDTIGLALFVVIGIQKTLAFDYPMWVAIVMGTLTGAFGGVLRDVLINNVPVVFKHDIYATACIVGGLVYWLILFLGGDEMLQQSACAVVVIALRVLSVRYHWELPVMRYGTDNAENDSGKME